jgi:glycogen debranching enzyme GlgX
MMRKLLSGLSPKADSEFRHADSESEILDFMAADSTLEGTLESKVTRSNGVRRPLGCSESRGGGPVNFALEAPGSNSAWLVLWAPDDYGNKQEKLHLLLDPKCNRTDNTSHIEISVPFQALGMRYAWLLNPPLTSNGQVDGRQPLKYIIDPCARALDSLHAAGWNYRGHERYSPKAVVPDYRVIQSFDWQGVQPPRHELQDLIMYEAHVRGFTMNSDSDISNHETHGGTFQGFLEKIPYLVELGVNCVELLPVFEFDETACPRKNPSTGEQLCNYWGYSTVNFYVPMQRFNALDRISGAIVGFKTLVRELHRVGIEVILDVVFNHTAEGTWGEKNWHSLAEIAKSKYYILNKGYDTNYTGCGNTVNANDPTCTEWILECLRYWVIDMHVDGFRFDLASALCRGNDGKIQGEPLLIKAMAADPTLKAVKLIAEPWDCSWPDGYLVGRFPSCGGKRWAEWNGKFRDTARRFIKGDEGLKGEMATRLSGSSDLYERSKRGPCHSINFITAHDGFTLRDLVSYDRKHNDCNGEQSGDDHNSSWNCGAEGDTDNGEINHMREKQMRNFLVALLLSMGTPMLTFGDEYGRSQKGCNNVWCQDRLSWFSWKECAKQENKLVRFTRLLIRMRTQYKHIFGRTSFLSSKDIVWRTNWDDPYNFLCYILHANDRSAKGYIGILIAFNAGDEFRECHMPEGKPWYRIIDTNLPPPKDFCEDESSASMIPGGSKYGMHPYSCIVLKTFQDSADAINYGAHDPQYSQDLQAALLNLRAVAGRQMSGELLKASDIVEEQIRATQMLMTRSDMTGSRSDLADLLPSSEAFGGYSGSIPSVVNAPEDESEGDEYHEVEEPPAEETPPCVTPNEETTETTAATGSSGSSMQPVNACADMDRIDCKSNPRNEAAKSRNEVSKLKPQDADKANRVAKMVRFLITFDGTQPGETIAIVGSLPELGSWNPDKAVACKTSADLFPMWESDAFSVDAASGSMLEFKLLIRGQGDSVQWETFDGNHVVLFPASCPNGLLTIQCSWGSPNVSASPSSSPNISVQMS